MGIRTVKITATTAAIAVEVGRDDFLAQAKAENKFALWREVPADRRALHIAAQLCGLGGVIIPFSESRPLMYLSQDCISCNATPENYEEN
jgi:hypothetical protein